MGPVATVSLAEIEIWCVTILEVLRLETPWCHLHRLDLQQPVISPLDRRRWHEARSPWTRRQIPQLCWPWSKLPKLDVI